MSERKVSINFAPFGLLATMLGVLFIGLKLGGVGVVATWSWLWVLSPFWIGFAAIFALFFLFLVVGGFIAWLASR